MSAGLGTLARLQRFGGLGAERDRNDLELHEVAPLGDPALEERRIVAFHHLKTTPEIGSDPTVHELQSVRHHPAALAKTRVNRLRILVSEAFDDNKLH